MSARVEHDLAYLRNWSLLLDLKIVLMTVVVVLKRKGCVLIRDQKDRGQRTEDRDCRDCGDGGRTRRSKSDR